MNSKQRQIKTAKCSPLSINNKIFKQITKIKNKQNINNVPTVIFNVNSNQILEPNNKIIQNSNESKSNNKSKSNDSKNSIFTPAIYEKKKRKGRPRNRKEPKKK